MATTRAPSRPRWRSAAWSLLLAGTLVQFGCQASPPASSPQPSAVTVQSTVLPGAPAEEAVANRYDLARDEKRGGHTLARHVGRSDDDLRERLRREPQISAASTYTDRPTAEHVVALALARDHARVDQWLSRQGRRPNLTLDYHGNRDAPIGRTLIRRNGRVVACSDALVVLRSDGIGDFYVLTTYPEGPR